MTERMSMEANRDPQAAAVETDARPMPAPPEAGLDEFQRVVTDGFERVRATLEENHALDRFREGQIERLHAELQAYKADLVGKAVRPVLQSLIRLHDDLGKVIEALRAADPTTLDPQRMLVLLQGFHEDVELALDHNGVSAFRTTGEDFDPRRQKAVRTVDVAEPVNVGKIAARVRPGFEQGEAILEKERVAVYVLSEPAAGTEEEKP
jgi:molecular chaperone GrpE